MSTPATPDTDRTISFYNLHTHERLTVTYKKDGRYDSAAMAKVNRMLRDWRRDETIRMDPELIDLVYTIHEELGSKQPIGIVSGYRSPVTNAKLRRRSSGVAKHSQHMLGKAMDVYFPDVPLKRLREAALIHQDGGVGYYPTSGRPFVHIDTGRVRHWPRLPRAELARLFPDGNTLHIPADGKPLARKVRTRDVQVARADTASRKAPTSPTRPIVVAQAEPSAPVRSPEATSEADGNFSLSSLSLLGFLETDEPAKEDEKPRTVVIAGLTLPEGSSAPMPAPRPRFELAGDEGAPLMTASLSRPVAPEDKPASQRPMMLASLGPAATAPSGGYSVLRREAMGIWGGGLSYEPPAVEPLVAGWRVHGEAFASFTAPDQVHLTSLMRAPGQSLSISFTRGLPQTPYADAFVGPAVAPLQVADLSAPLVTAAR